jgi:hypothetical protein
VADEMDCKHALPFGKIRQAQNPNVYAVHEHATIAKAAFADVDNGL